MRTNYLVITAAGLGLIIALFAPSALMKRREALRQKKEHDWMQTAIHQLSRTPPPSPDLGWGTNTLDWITPDYLVFSNGWAVYKMHWFHENDGMRDMAFLRGPDGALYFTRRHFCGGGLEPGKNKVRPRDLKEFLEKYDTSWRPYPGS
jgi:hypothetical protein